MRIEIDVFLVVKATEDGNKGSPVITSRVGVFAICLPKKKQLKC